LQVVGCYGDRREKTWEAMGENKLARNSSLNSLHMEIMVIWRMYRQV
jgi:hypothetical protein